MYAVLLSVTEGEQSVMLHKDFQMKEQRGVAMKDVLSFSRHECEFIWEEINVLQIHFTCIFIRCLTLFDFRREPSSLLSFFFFFYFTFEPKPGSCPGRNFQTGSL